MDSLRVYQSDDDSSNTEHAGDTSDAARPSNRPPLAPSLPLARQPPASADLGRTPRTLLERLPEPLFGNADPQETNAAIAAHPSIARHTLAMASAHSLQPSPQKQRYPTCLQPAPAAPAAPAIPEQHSPNYRSVHNLKRSRIDEPPRELRPYTSKRSQSRQSQPQVTTADHASTGSLSLELAEDSQSGEHGPLIKKYLGDHDSAGSELPRTVGLLLEGHTKGVNRLAWHPRGSLLASASQDGTVFLWDFMNGKSPTLSIRHDASVKDLTWSPDGSVLASIGFSKRLLQTDVCTGATLFTAEHADYGTCVRFHPRNPNLLLSGTVGSGLMLWDTRISSNCQRRFQGNFGQVHAVEFVPDGTKFISTADVLRRNAADKGLVVWDIETPTVLFSSLYLEAYSCPSIRIHPHEQQFVALSNGNYVMAFGLKPPFKQIKSRRFSGQSVDAFPIQVAFSPSGATMSSGCSSGNLVFWRWRQKPQDRRNRQEPAEPEKVVRHGHDGPSIQFEWRPTVHVASKVVGASCGWSDGTVKLWQ
ncbi:WD40-repeat-containing domain protein [Polychytrium aggregatum]|uniref:WD40-repeat-containing domain protein n=1 Tax=Polychytrium aggregatum TaxID=110093 RepID=UPI0022FDB54D|nr:WD40-repeat-containing domain protein [Polychytrium aggregatum]KAI9207811.1 WD40-repeat-containing domain protein [Polychytrium aggregatum]